MHSAEWRAARREDPSPDAVRERISKRYRAREES
jgi:hypothetical protein